MRSLREDFRGKEIHQRPGELPPLHPGARLWEVSVDSVWDPWNFLGCPVEGIVPGQPELPIPTPDSRLEKPRDGGNGMDFEVSPIPIYSMIPLALVHRSLGFLSWDSTVEESGSSHGWERVWGISSHPGTLIRCLKEKPEELKEMGQLLMFWKRIIHG